MFAHATQNLVSCGISHFDYVHVLHVKCIHPSINPSIAYTCLRKINKESASIIKEHAIFIQ